MIHFKNQDVLEHAIGEFFAGLTDVETEILENIIDYSDMAEFLEHYSMKGDGDHV
jgi:hypothetical protein